ncbi:dihydrodipicolinate synthase family protein [Cohnella faecalis]|uniref:N-acetylneuraminate lyase n=1 Tax=Cohnella faecalis TaxID=2315694 RepID=A0A398CK46_9BACL|nr:dihydrodipicolinate synthase family protein [Cohnella faecalis]RIE01569.1 N-acetylneuraminate lyase [Cohnella faecalis]
MKPYDLNKFKGVFIAMNSCYDEQGEVSPERAKKLARHYADIGVKGLYLAGSTGEGMLQSVEERKQILQAVMEEVRGELIVIAHIGAASTRDCVELTVHAESVGADAISAVPSIYYRISEKGVEEHWQAIIDSSSLPFIMYHIPATTGFHLSKDLLGKLAKQDKVIGVKITTDSTYELQQFKRIGGEDFILFNGPDEQYVAGLIMGAEAGIGGTYGVMPELFMKIEQCFAEGKIAEAQHWQIKVNEIITELVAFPSLYGASKLILKLRGIDTGIPRMPISPIPESDYSKIEALNHKILHYIEEAKSEGIRV